MKSFDRERRPAWWDDANANAMLICRISDRKQADGVSLDAQQHQQQAYIERVGLRVAAVESFQESAKKSQLRKQFHAAIDRAQRSNIKHLVFYVWDRIARNFTDAEMLEELVREGDVIVHIASGGTVLHKDSDDSDFFVFDINIAQAKQDNRARRRKTIDGMEQRCRNGWYPSRPPSFYIQQPLLDENGRPKRRGSVIVGPSEKGRRLLRREMELHMRGFSLSLIREKCLSEGLVPAKMIPTFHDSLIDKHLKNPFYAALEKPHDGFKSQFVWRDIWYEAKHEPVFTHDEWVKLKASFGLKTTQRKLRHKGLFAIGPLTLTCDDPDCRCKITFAPKFKAGATIYKYYRCSDGKRVHRKRGEPQANVPEQSILDQLGGAVDSIHMNQATIDEITRGLNEAHKTAMASKAKAAEAFRLELQELEVREDRLFDRFDKSEVDRETYERQLARLRTEKADRFEKLRDAERATDEATYLITAQRVLELAKVAKSLWQQASLEQKRDLLARLVCNPRLAGRTMRYDLRKPYAILAKMRGSAGWRPQRESKTLGIAGKSVETSNIVVTTSEDGESGSTPPPEATGSDAKAPATIETVSAPTDPDEALRTAIKVAVDAGQWARVRALTDVLASAPSPAQVIELAGRRRGER